MLRPSFIILYLFLLGLLAINTAKASHIMGGDLTYKNVGNNKVELKFLLYRDCNSGQVSIDNSITYRIYDASYSNNGNYTKYKSRTVNIASKKKVMPEIPNCSLPTGVCVEQGLFIDTITLGADTVGYHVVWFRNERNNSIITNLDYGNCLFNTKKPYGSIWHTFIPRQSITNSSPQFLTVPIPYLCSGKKNVFNPLVSDADKDSLVFSLETPYSPPAFCGSAAIPTPYPPGHADFSKVVYVSGYSASKPFGSSTSISINATTGEITAYTGSSGSYVIAIQIKEYRVNPLTKKTEYVGEVRRDLQFIVGSCPSNTPPQMQKDTLNYVRYIDPGDTVCFTVSGADVYDTLYLSAAGGIFSSNPVIDPPYATFTGTLNAYQKVSGEFCWAPSCDQITYSSPYIIVFNLSDQGCNTVSQTYSIYVKNRPLQTPPAIHCVDALGNDSLRITISDSATKDGFYQYKIYRDSNYNGIFKLVDTLAPFTKTSWTDKKAYGANKVVYRYYITAQNTCGLEGLESDTVSNILLTATKLSDKKAYLNWNKQYSNSAVWYKIYADEGSGFQKIDSTKALDTYLNSCYRKLKLQIRAEDTSGLCISRSNTIAELLLQDAAAPDTGRIFSVNVLSLSQIDVSFSASDSNDTYYYYLYSSVNGGAFTLADSLKHIKGSASYMFEQKNLSAHLNQYCYKLKIKDTCGNISPYTAEYCGALLTGSAGQLANFLKWKLPKAEEPLNSLALEEYVNGGWVSKQNLNLTDTAIKISGLICQQAYTYRLRFQFKGNFMYGSDLSDSITLVPFDTVAPASPMISYITVSAAKNIDLSWQASADADVVKYYIYRKDASASGFTPIDTVAKVTQYTDNKINSDSASYCYAIKAVDSCAANASAFSVTHCSMFLQGQSSGCVQELKLNWSAYTGWQAGVAKYEIYRQASDESSESLLASVSGSALSYSDKAIVISKSYTYRIKAIQSSGAFTSYSNKLTLKTLWPATPVIQFASKTITSASTGRIVIKWNSLKNSPSLKYLHLYHKGPSASAFTLLQSNIPVAKDSIVHSGLNTNTANHSYFLISEDSCGNFSDTSLLHTTTELKMTVGQLTHNLSWTPYIGWPVKKYIVQYWQGGNWASVDSVAGSQTSLTRIPMPCNMAVFYRIGAKDAAGNIAYSDSAGGQAIDNIPANAVTINNLTVTSNTQVQINFRGADSADVFGYAVLRSDNGGAYNAVNFIYYNGPGKNIVLNDAVDAENDQYCYIIVTLDSCLNATNSDTFCTIHLGGKALNQADSLKWNNYKGYAVKDYILQYELNGVWKDITTFSSKDSAYLHDSLACYVPIRYRMKGVEDGGSRITFSNTLDLTPIDTISPPAPILRYATTVPGKGVQLEWEWDTKSDVKYFEVYRKDPQSNYKLIKLVQRDSIYFDPVSPLNTAYYYFVTAVDSCDITRRSAPSDINRLMEISLSTNDCSPLARVYWTHYQGLPYRADEYRIYRYDGSNSPTLAGTVAYPQDSFIDVDIKEGTRYTYIVEAYDKESGYTSRSDTSSIIPYVFPVPQGVAIKRATVLGTGTTNGEIQIDWENLKSADIYAKGYHLYYAAMAAGPYILIKDEQDLTKTSFTHTNIDTRSGSFWYKVAPYNICGKEAAPSPAHHAINLSAVNNSLEVALSWNKYVGFAVDHYEIERALGAAALTTRYSVAATDSTFSDTAVFCGKQYSYRIKAVESGGNNAVAYSDTITAIAFDNTPPTKADIQLISVKTTDLSNGEMDIVFNGATDKNRKGYILYISIGGNPFKAIDTIKTSKATNILYTDKKRNTYKNTFEYYVRAYDSCGNVSEPSDTHRNVIVQAQAQNNENVLYWGNYKGFGNVRFVVEKRVAGSQTWNPVNVQYPGSVNRYEDFEVKCNILYEYRIRIEDTLARLVSYSNTDTARAFETIKPLVPDIVNATVTVTGNGKGKADINWLPSKSKDVAQTQVFRKSAGGSSWTQIATIGNVTSYTDANINTYRSSFSYKIRTIDSCGNISNDTSEIHTTINLIATPGNEVIQLDWNKYAGFKVLNYELYKNGNLLKIFDSTELTYVDTGAVCTRQESYILKAIGPDAMSVSLSNKDSATPYDHNPPKPLYLATATVWTANSQAAVVWARSASADVKGYKVYRRMGSSGVTLVHQADGVNDTTFIDNLSFNGQPVCYQVVAYDNCQNTSDLSNVGCLIQLSGKSGEQVNQISWNAYTKWQRGVDFYKVYRMEDSGNWVQIGVTDSNVHFYKDIELGSLANSYCYQVEAVERQGPVHNAKSRSTVFCLYQPPLVWIPNAFTPTYSINLNDAFGPKGSYFNKFDMWIYNRWGERVYETTDSKPWNGQQLNKGGRTPEGVYLYRITVYGLDGKRHDFEGTVHYLD